MEKAFKLLKSAGCLSSSLNAFCLCIHYFPACLCDLTCLFPWKSASSFKLWQWFWSCLCRAVHRFEAVRHVIQQVACESSAGWGLRASARVDINVLLLKLRRPQSTPHSTILARTHTRTHFWICYRTTPAHRLARSGQVGEFTNSLSHTLTRAISFSFLVRSIRVN